MEKNNERGSGECRDKTNHSLKSERDKTNFFLESSTESIEQMVDEDIKSGRRSADATRDLSRVAAENLQNGKKRFFAQSKAEADLTSERAQSDEERGRERLEEDRLHQKERYQKSLVVEALLASERHLTDADLLDERAMFDSTATELGDLLSTERELHQISIEDLATRNRYLAIVSHDLKNPLAAISMSAYLIRTSMERGVVDAEKIIKRTELIERNVASMERMITHLLDTERIARAKLNLNYEMHHPSKFLKDCNDLFASVALAKGLTLSCVCECEQMQINCDYDRILQVLSNLIGNALKFTPKGGEIEVAARGHGTSVEFSVRDTGLGIPDQTKDRIFDEFSQLESIDRSGLGLGLYISKSLIEAHGGKLKVCSKVNVGSTFSFTLSGLPRRHDT